MNKIRMWQIALAIFAITLLAIVGFSQMPDSTPSGLGPIYPLDDSTEDSTEEDVSEETAASVSLDDVIDVEGWYVYNESADTVEYFYYGVTEMLNVTSDMVNGTKFITGDSDPYSVLTATTPITIDRSAGDELILISSSSMNPSCDFRPIAQAGYCQGVDIEGDPFEYDEIEGTSTAGMSDSDMTEFLDGYGVSWNRYSGYDSTWTSIESNEPVTLSAGWYEGTQWHDGQIDLSNPYYIVLGTTIECDNYTSTKNGYFIIDLSSLEPGLYELTCYQPASLDDVVVEII